MADETILTPPATETSATNEPAPAAPAVETAPQAEGTTAEAETSVLGGELKDEVAAPEDAAPAVPEKYELALEGVDLDPVLVEAAQPILREAGLTNEQANAILPIAGQLVEATQNKVMQSLIDAGAQQRKAWLDAFVADPEIGGANREQTEHLAAKGLDALGYTAGHPFRAALTESGFGNHPDMIRAFRRLGELVAEDGAFPRDGAGPSNPLPIEKRLYPDD